MIGLMLGVELLSAMYKESYSGFKYKLFLGALENLAGLTVENISNEVGSVKNVSLSFFFL